MHSISAISSEDCGDVQSAEAALVRAAQEDLTAFAPLYERYRDRIYAYLRTRTRSAEDAADLTQQVFLQALDALPRYRPQRCTGGDRPRVRGSEAEREQPAHRHHRHTRARHAAGSRSDHGDCPPAYQVLHIPRPRATASASV